MVSPRVRALAFRVVGHIALALVAVSIPAVGPNRFLLAGLLVGFACPTAVALNLLLGEQTRNWAEAAFDLLLVITLVHLVPHLWLPAMCLGLMVTLAPSVSLHPASHWIYLTMGSVLLIGMTFAALGQGPKYWELAVIAVAVTYPSMLFYTYTQMQRSNRLRERAQMVKSMAEVSGNVAHDFNNMLTSIGGHAQLAIANATHTGEDTSHMEEVLNGTERASLLCDQLLSFSGRTPDRPRQLDVAQEVTALSALLQPALPAGVTIDFDEPAAPLYINADLSELNQVLMNVVLNAGEAMIDAPGTIALRLQRVGDEQGLGTIELTVTDSGVGIPANIMPRIFERLYTTKESGHGYGLDATRRIMASLGGSIAIKANADAGTHVRLTWPEALASSPNPTTTEPTDRTPPPKQPNNSSLAKVLVVDDDARVRKVATGLLERLGYNALTAANTADAIAQFEGEHHNIGAIILDLKMPGEDGWTCLEKIRAISSSTLVLICSGFNPSESLPEVAVRDPNLSFLRKPYRAKDLASALALEGGVQSGANGAPIGL